MADVEDALPWGLHDAHLESIEIDWLNARASLTVRVGNCSRERALVHGEARRSRSRSAASVGRSTTI